MTQSADHFRRSDVFVWGTAAAVACAAALISANVAAVLPQGALAALHDSRAVNAQAAELTAEVAALDGSKSNLLKLADAQQKLETAQRQTQLAQQQAQAAQQRMLATEDQLRTAQQAAQATAAGLDSRLAGLEKTVATEGTRLSALQIALPRRVATLSLGGTDRSLLTGSISAGTPSFGSPAGAIERMPAQPKPAQPVPVPSPAPSELGAVTPIDPGPQWSAAASLPVFSASAPRLVAIETPALRAEGSDAASPPPFPMSPRRAEATPKPLDLMGPGTTASAGAITPPMPPRARPDVRAIGVAIGNPVAPAAALASWQQIAENVGVLLVGMSPLLADDPAGSPSKVLVAGPVSSIAAATALCGKVEQAALSCTPMPYVGAGLNAASSR